MRQAINSYRQNPTSAATGTIENPDVIRDDSDKLQSFAEDQFVNNAIPNTSGSVTIQGAEYYNNGEIVDTISTDNGDINVGLCILTAPISYASPHQAGESSTDTTSIEFGRV